MPMFSLVIPTRARAETLRHALRTVVAEAERDLEIIVHESGDDPATASVLAQFDDPRIRTFKTITPVWMTENWERALRCATGQYIFFLGDDDGLLPNAFAIARHILSAEPVEMLCWRPAQYFWPDCADASLRGRISSVYGTSLQCTMKDSRTALHLTYRFRQHYLDLPMIYNSFVARELIEKVVKLRSRYFVGSMPDVVSGAINLFFSVGYLQCNRPLSLSGVSRESTGYRFFSGKPDLRSEAVRSAFGNIKIHPSMVYSHDPVLAIGNELLIVKDELFPEAAPEFDHATMLLQALQSLNYVPEQYDLVLAQCRAIAEKNGLTIGKNDVVPRAQRPPPARFGRFEIGPGVVLNTVDGQSVAATNVFDATRALDRLLAEIAADPCVISVEPKQIEAIALDSSNRMTLNFSKAGNGALILGLGWGGVENWGVWSLGSRSDLVFPFDARFHGSLKITISGRVFHPPRTLRFEVEQDSRFLHEHEVTVTTEVFDFDLFPIDMSMSHLATKLRITLLIDDCASPSELGLSDDIRKLGFGLQRVQISSASP
jgi:glycosyltransferase involved in cell wall biosynthesis